MNIPAAIQPRCNHSAHVARYLARVDAHMPTLPAAQRSAFLATEMEKWIERYHAFQRRVDNDLPTSPEICAADFLLTIAGLDKRSAELRRAS